MLAMRFVVLHILMMNLIDSVTVIEKVRVIIAYDPTLSLYYVGYLCGDCKDNKGVSALLNHCVDCNDINVVLIGGLST